MAGLPAELLEDRVVAVLRAPSLANVDGIVLGLAEAGIRSIELTYTISDVLKHVEHAAKLPGVSIGVGTVLSEQQAIDAINAGAAFLVTPAVRPAVGMVGTSKNIPVLMGAWTPTEVAAALDCAPAAVKLFPGEMGGPNHLKALRGPFSKATFVPSGGVSAANAKDWLAAGAVAVSAGGSLAPAETLIRGDATPIVQAAKVFVRALESA
jgi:2-dehydro-3-deoxyphosphogluconate aldolase/(4S)-4-hydroxy-2-oxoglutarate aldolase